MKQRQRSPYWMKLYAHFLKLEISPSQASAKATAEEQKYLSERLKKRG